MGFDGFDAIELVTGLEDRLGITISDGEAERLHTPGETVEYLASRVSVRRWSADDRCRSAVAFRLGRQRLSTLSVIPRAAIRPSTLTTTLLPPDADGAARRATWEKMSQALGIRLPSLQHSGRLRGSAAAAGCVTAIGVLLHARHEPPTTAAGVGVVTALVILGMFAVPWMLLTLTRRRFAVGLPVGCDTVGHLTSRLALQTVPNGPASAGGWSRLELWELVRDLTASSAGCSPTCVTPDARWGTL